MIVYSDNMQSLSVKCVANISVVLLVIVFFVDSSATQYR